MKVTQPRLASAPAPRPALVSGTIEAALSCSDRGLKFDLGFQPDRGRVTRTEGTLAALQPRAFDTMRYGTKGSTGNEGLFHIGVGAGVLAAVGDGARGLLLVDLVGQEVVAGGDPTIHGLRDLKQLAKEPAIARFAKAAGLTPKKMAIDFEEVGLSAGFTDRNFHTLKLRLKFDDGVVQQSGEFTAILAGNLADGPSALRLGSFEAGAADRSGWTLPPSYVKVDRFERPRRNKFAA